MEATIAMVTTVDNPYDPFEQYTEWFTFDTRHGYNTASFLARVCFTTKELSELDYHRAVEEAVDEVVSENVLGLYKKVTKKIELD